MTSAVHERFPRRHFRAIDQCRLRRGQDVVTPSLVDTGNRSAPPLRFSDFGPSTDAHLMSSLSNAMDLTSPFRIILLANQFARRFTSAWPTLRLNQMCFSGNEVDVFRKSHFSNLYFRWPKLSIFHAFPIFLLRIFSHNLLYSFHIVAFEKKH